MPCCDPHKIRAELAEQEVKRLREVIQDLTTYVGKIEMECKCRK